MPRRNLRYQRTNRVIAFQFVETYLKIDVRNAELDFPRLQDLVIALHVP